MISKTVAIDVGERKYILSPTLRALEAAEEKYGDLVSAMENAHKFSTVALFVAVGANLKGDDVKRMREEVFAAGYGQFVPSIREFILLLSNPSGEDGAEPDSGNE